MKRTTRIIPAVEPATQRTVGETVTDIRVVRVIGEDGEKKSFSFRFSYVTN